MVTATQTPPGVTSSFEARVLAARTGDLADYARAAHNTPFEDYQYAWAEALDTENRLLIVCPPDTFKSTTVRLWAERAIGRNKNIRILWLMNSGEQAQKQVMTVAQTIKSNNVYRAAFGVEPDNDAQWTKSVLFLKRDVVGPDPTLMATGFNGPFQGLHFDVIIIDDPTNPEDVRSPTTMEFQRQKLRGVILDRLLEGGRIVSILTRWGEEDLVPTFQDMRFTTVQMPVLGNYPWGPTLSSRRFSLDRIEQIRQDKGEYLFTLTYMCDALGASEGMIIRREHLRYWDQKDIEELVFQFFVGVDPAASTKTRADRSAVATVGLDVASKRLYLADMWANRVDTPALEKEIVRRCGRVSGLRAVGLETVGYQISLLQNMRHRYHLPFKEVPYRSRIKVAPRKLGLDRNKVGRAMYLDSLFCSGRLFLPRKLPLVDGVSLEAELCSISNDDNKMDDRMDALAIACVLADASAPRRQLVRVRA